MKRAHRRAPARLTGRALVVVCVAVGACGGGRERATLAPMPAADALMAADLAFARDSRARGAEAWADVWAEDGRLQGASGAAVGPEAVRRAMAPTMERLGARFRWEPVESGMLWPDSLGYTLGWYRVEAEDGGVPEDEGRYLTVWRRTGEGWRVALDVALPDDTAGTGDFDFWVGDWEVDQRIRVAADSFGRYPARARVRATAAGAVVVESWQGRVRFVWAGMQEAASIRGASVRIHDPETDRWRIFWIDTLEPRFGEPFEGRFEAGQEATGTFERPDGEGGRVRIRFRPQHDGSVRWDLAALGDGEPARTLWTMEFTRAGAGTGRAGDPTGRAGDATGRGANASAREILFIGNSLTLRNDLPAMVQGLASEAGWGLRTRVVGAPGTSLEDHWDGGVASVIGRGGWSAVVLQQGPSTLPESRAHLVRWAGRLADTARAVGAAPYLTMVWPPLDGDWDRGAESYRQAAAAASAGLFPVAEAFRAAWRRDPSLRLLAHDDFHPAPLGTYLAALVILAQLEGRPPDGVPRAVPGMISVDAGTSETLRAAVREAIAAHGRDPG